MRVPACQYRLPEEERVAGGEGGMLHPGQCWLGCEDSGRKELSPPGKPAALLGARHLHPLGSSHGGSPFFLVIPGVFPKAPLVSHLFWRALGATREDCRKEGGVAGYRRKRREK